MFKRIILFLLTNLAIMLVLGITASLLGIHQGVSPGGINISQLMGFALFWGFGGAFISLLLSKPIAKWSTGAKIIDGTEGSTERWLVATVRELSERAGIGMPDVALYEGEPNAFATGAFKNSALVAVSSGLLSGMKQDEVKAVLAHEIGHIANGDMITMTLIQGVVNAFVIVIARIIGFFVDKVILKNENNTGIGYYITVFAMEIILGIAASTIVLWFSRQREFRADAASAQLYNSQSMINALGRLEQMSTGALPKNMAALGIGGTTLSKLFSTHPPIAERIEALRKRN